MTRCLGTRWLQRHVHIIKTYPSLGCPLSSTLSLCTSRRFSGPKSCAGECLFLAKTVFSLDKLTNCQSAAVTKKTLGFFVFFLNRGLNPVTGPKDLYKPISIMECIRIPIFTNLFGFVAIFRPMLVISGSVTRTSTFEEPRIPLSLAAPALVYARFSMEARNDKGECDGKSFVHLSMHQSNKQTNKQAMMMMMIIILIIIHPSNNQSQKIYTIYAWPFFSIIPFFPFRVIFHDQPIYVWKNMFIQDEEA